VNFGIYLFSHYRWLCLYTNRRFQPLNFGVCRESPKFTWIMADPVKQQKFCWHYYRLACKIQSINVALGHRWFHTVSHELTVIYSCVLIT